ncbi:MucR family transcriptional regulator [Mesorhizobium sp. M0130]
MQLVPRERDWTRFISIYPEQRNARSGFAGLIAGVNSALSALVQPVAAPPPEFTPAINPKKSIFPDYIISLENGRKFKSMKRHLGLLDMTPDEYRAKWRLAWDYPTVAMQPSGLLWPRQAVLAAEALQKHRLGKAPQSGKPRCSALIRVGRRQNLTSR